MVDRSGTFREKLRDYMRRATPYDGKRATQKDLAEAIHLDLSLFNKRLNNIGGKSLKAADVKAIVLTLAEWHAITTQEQAIELLDLMDCAHFSPAEWGAEPLDKLLPVKPPFLSLNGTKPYGEKGTELSEHLNGHLSKQPHSQNLFTVLPCPYRGLAAFREEDAAFFFGRETFVSQLFSVMQEQPLVAIIGPSGCGKSSVVFAGLIPKLRYHENLLVAVCRPSMRPFHNLAAALLPLLETDLAEIERMVKTNNLAESLEEGKLNLAQIAERIVEKNPTKSQLLLVIDQFEELYTQCLQEQTRRKFLDAILTVLPGQSQGYTQPESRVRLVLTLRADFFSHALSNRPFADALQIGQRNLGPMCQEELKATIEGPATNLGLGIEEGLTERIIEAVSSSPGDLPLLEFTLSLLWEKQVANYLTHQSYAELGGVEQALVRYAEAVYQKFKVEDRSQLQYIFCQLVQPGEGTEDTRRLATRLELGEKNWQLITSLASERLVVSDRDPVSSQETAELVHEALIEKWQRLRDWLSSDRQFRLWQERVRLALRQWQANRQNNAALLQGLALSEAEHWLNERAPHLSQAEKRFIEASITARDRVRTQRAKMRRLVTGGLVSGLVVLALVALVAFIEWSKASQAQATAETQRRFALYSALSAQVQNYYKDNRLDLGLLVSLEALKINPGPQARGNLLDGLTHNPNLMMYLHGHRDAVTSVVFSPDGKVLASSSYDKTIRLWEVASGKVVSQWQAHNDKVTNLAFSPDGQSLASASFDKTARLWEVATGQELGQPLFGHTDVVTSVVFSPDGKILASSSYDKTIRLWEVTTGRPIGLPLQAHTEDVTGLAFTPDGKTLASSSSDSTIRLWEVATGKTIGQPLTGHTTYVAGLTFSPDGKMLASAGFDGTIIFWHPGLGNSLSRPLKGHTDKILRIAFSPDSKMLASTSYDKTIRLWEVATGQPVGQPLIGHTDIVSSVAFSPDGKMLASGSYDKTVKLWEVATGKPVAQFDGHTDTVASVAFSPDGKMLASAGFDKTIRLWEVVTGKPVAQFEPQSASLSSIAFSPDGKTLASGSLDGTIKLLDIATKNLLTPSFQGHTSGVSSVAFSPDGKILASGSLDTTVRLWEVATGRLIGSPLQGHTSYVAGVAFSPDGVFVASGGFDKTVRLWEVTTGKSVGEPLKSHSDAVFSVVFSPDGKTLASASLDQSIRLWDFNLLSWEKQACTIANRNLTQLEWQALFGDEPYRPTCSGKEN